MNILLVGFYGEGNLGDDTILSCLTHNLNTNHQLFITLGGAINLTRGIKIKRRGLSSWPTYINTVRSCQHTILSGGILQDWSFEGTTFFALRMLAARLANSKVSLWGAGLGPVQRKGLLPLVRKALKKVNCAWVRDSQSLNFFEQMTGNKAHLGTDWSWDIACSPEKKSPRKLTGINLRNWKHSEWKEMFKREKNQLSGKIIGLAARKNDINAIRANIKNISVVKPDDFENILSLCEQLDKGIAMRYHIALAMLRSQIPVKLLAYDEKIRNLAIDANVSLLSSEHKPYRAASTEFLTDNYQRISKMKATLKNYIDAGV